jgi:hypothetical protein
VLNIEVQFKIKDFGQSVQALLFSTWLPLEVAGNAPVPRSRSLQVSDSFPFKWINKKWKEGFHVTSMATSHTRWAVVMSRNACFVEQCVELDFQYPSEGIHRRWDANFRITSCASTPDQVCPAVASGLCRRAVPRGLTALGHPMKNMCCPLRSVAVLLIIACAEFSEQVFTQIIVVVQIVGAASPPVEVNAQLSMINVRALFYVFFC